MKLKGKYILLLIPGLAGVMIFYVIPFFASVYYSLVEGTFSSKFAGISNYVSIFSNRYFRLALANTLEFTSVAVPATVFISFIVALLLVSRVKKFLAVRMAFIVPVLLPSAAVIFFWQMIFPDGIFSGMVTGKLVWLPVYLLFIWKNTGLNMILFIAAFASIPADIYEAAALDGASALKKHFYITTPLVMPATLFVIMITTVNSFRIFKEIYLLYGSYPAESMYTLQNYMNNHFLKMNYQNLAAAAIIFFLIVYAIVAAGLGTGSLLEKRIGKGMRDGQQ